MAFAAEQLPEKKSTPWLDFFNTVSRPVLDYQIAKHGYLPEGQQQTHAEESVQNYKNQIVIGGEVENVNSANIVKDFTLAK